MRRALMFVGAVWPLIYMVLFIGLIVESVVRSGGNPDNDLLVPFEVLMGLHIATMLVILAATVAYVVHAWRSPRIQSDQRVLWLIVLLLGGFIAMPVYWWLYLRSPQDAANEPATATV